MAQKTKNSPFRFRPLLWINYIFIVLLLFSNLNPVLAPDVFWPMTILGLVFPVIVIVNILFVVFWLIFLKRYLFYSLLAIILTYSIIFDHFQFEKKPIDFQNESSIKLLSFNGRNLSNTNINKGDKILRGQISEYIANENADIICFQEFQSYPTRGVNSVNDFRDRFSLSFVKEVPYLQKNTHEFLDLMVVFSKYPIKNFQSFYMDGKCYGFYIDLDIKGKICRLFNLHLESNHFNKHDYDIFTEKEAKLDEKKRNQMIWLIQKLKKYGVRRSYQAKTIKKEIESSPYPVIVAGDFNDTPASYTYQHISFGLNDAFHERGSGYGQTYNGKLPPMRIDYMLFDKTYKILDFQILKPDFSDHFPITAKFEIIK